MSSKYEVVIYYNESDEVFVAEVPELSGCRAVGKTKVEALEGAESTITDWIETARTIGRPVPEPKGHRTYLRLILPEDQLSLG